MMKYGIQLDPVPTKRGMPTNCRVKSKVLDIHAISYLKTTKTRMIKFGIQDNLTTSTNAFNKILLHRKQIKIK